VNLIANAAAKTKGSRLGCAVVQMSNDSAEYRYGLTCPRK
jgi:hypothetical protein